MSTTLLNESIEEDEIFFGKMSLREMKKHLSVDREISSVLHRKSFGCVESEFCNDLEESLKIIETQSEPDLIQLNDSSIIVNINKPLDDTATNILTEIHDVQEKDSVINLEDTVAVTNLPCYDDHNQHDNTLEIIDYILKHNPKNAENNNETNNVCKSMTKDTDEMQFLTPIKDTCMQHDAIITNDSPIKNNMTPPFLTPKKYEAEYFSTPAEPKIKTQIFKTPANVVSIKKPVSSIKRTPLKTNAMYQHITSPVASYINESPRVPLVKEVHPKKPLPGPSSIPKMVKSVSHCTLLNKENISLPSIAYKSAKTTKMIDAPSQSKLPESHWAKKITSSLPRPVVIKHDHRENNFTKKVVHSQQENSFADLSLHQADLSVCTQKSAYIKPKK